MPSSAKKDRIISLFPPHVGNDCKYIIAHVPLNKALQYSVFINKLSFGRRLEINLRKITEIAQNIYVGHCFIMTLLQSSIIAVFYVTFSILFSIPSGYRLICPPENKCKSCVKNIDCCTITGCGILEHSNYITALICGLNKTETANKALLPTYQLNFSKCSSTDHLNYFIIFRFHS